MTGAVKACRACGRGPDEVRFSAVSVHRCEGCRLEARAAQRQRIAARGPRVVVARAVREDVCAAHLAWVRTLACAVHGRSCGGGVAHHVRVCSGSGVGRKPGDGWAVPLCHAAHGEGHDRGWITFEGRYRVDLRTLATKLAAASPFLSDNQKQRIAQQLLIGGSAAPVAGGKASHNLGLSMVIDAV